MDHAALEAAFGDAAPAHFEWQTRAPVVAEAERALIEAAFLPLGGRVLDLGCGEGATLYHLGAPRGAVGVDLFPRKIAFAQATLPQCTFIAASVYALPFDAQSFDHILVRDVVHHLEHPARFFDECARVLAPGGRIDVLEPCRNNPLIAMHALLNKAERGELRSTETFLRREVGRCFGVEHVARMQPFPIHRLVFHPNLGRPALASSALVRGSVAGIERVMGALLPRLSWAYLHVRGSAR